MADAKEKVLSQETLDLAKKLKKELTIENGKVVVPKDLYVQNLPEDVSEADIRKVQKHNSTFMPAITKAIGELAVKEFKADKKLDAVEADIPLVGRDKFSVDIKRSKEVRNISTGETRTVFGTMSAGVTTYAANKARGEMHLVAEELKASALAAYGE